MLTDCAPIVLATQRTVKLLVKMTMLHATVLRIAHMISMVLLPNLFAMEPANITENKIIVKIKN